MTAPALHVEAVISAIATTVTVTGLTVCDLDEIPEAADGREALLFPSPAEPSFVSDFSIETASFGGATLGLKDAYYTLNYVLFYQMAGAGRGLFDVVPGLVAMAVDIMEAILALDNFSGAVEFTPILGDFIEVTDPIGNIGIGCMISLQVHEFMN